jgi:hypothetical protein
LLVEIAQSLDFFLAHFNVDPLGGLLSVMGSRQWYHQAAAAKPSIQNNNQTVFDHLRGDVIIEVTDDFFICVFGVVSIIAL